MVFFSNRALGLLHNYIVQHGSNVQEWHIPATICHTVPFLFRKLGKTIVFYDIGFDTALIGKNISGNGKRGLLLYDYLGKSWKQADVAALWAQFDCLILDSCLSRPVLEENTDAVCDLHLFSTGDKKYTNLGYGGYGYSKQAVKLDAAAPAQTEAWENKDHMLEDAWKACNSKTDLQQITAEMTGDWVDTTDSKITPAYMQQVKEETEKVATHKARLNSIYERELPTELWIGEGWNEWRFQLLVSDRDALMGTLFANGLFASKHYRNAARLFGQEDCANANFVEQHIMNLFNDFYMTEEKAARTAQLIRTAYEKGQIQAVKHNIPV